jgi:hypothetical protein
MGGATISLRKGDGRMSEFDEMLGSPHNRRAFIARMSAAGLGTAALALLPGCGGGSSSPAQGGNAVIDPANFPGITGRNINDVVLNYALTLEILEADLYRQALNAASGRALAAPLDSTTPAAGTTGAYTLGVSNGSVGAEFSAPAFIYLVQFAYVEAAHRDFLQAALGAIANPVRPASGRYKFATANGTPGTDLGTILSNVLPLEETGVRAYLGALPYLTDLATAQTAGTIYSTECRHSASIEYILGVDPGPRRNIPGVPTPEQEVQPSAAANTFEKFLAPKAVLTAASTAFFA